MNRYIYPRIFALSDTHILKSFFLKNIYIFFFSKMKFGILFSLFSLLIVNIVNINAESTVSCGEYFNIPMCNECQTEIWNSLENPSTCGFSIHLINEIAKKYNYTFEYSHPISYDTTLYDEAV